MSSEMICTHPCFFVRRARLVKAGRNRSRSGQLMTERRGGQLPQCLKTAILVVAILIASCMDATAEQLLTAEDIKREIVGHSFQGRKGIMSVTMHYGQDGTVRMKSPLGTGEGHWTLVDNQLCVTLVTGPRKADECLTLTSLSKGEYSASNGLRLTLKQ